MTDNRKTLRVSGVADDLPHQYLLPVFHSFGLVERLYLSKTSKHGARVAVVRYDTRTSAQYALRCINDDPAYGPGGRWRAQWAKRPLPDCA